MERMPAEVLHILFSQQDAMTLMVAIPQVCKRWRTLCQAMRNVHLDFSWCYEEKWDAWISIPVEALVGWRHTTFMLSSIGGSSHRAKIAGWKTGMCDLFPNTTSVTLAGEDVEDALLMALADKCPGSGTSTLLTATS